MLLRQLCLAWCLAEPGLALHQVQGRLKRDIRCLQCRVHLTLLDIFKYLPGTICLDQTIGHDKVGTRYTRHDAGPHVYPWHHSFLCGIHLLRLCVRVCARAGLFCGCVLRTGGTCIHLGIGRLIFHPRCNMRAFFCHLT